MSKIQRVLKVFRKHWITVWLVVAVMTSVGIIAYASFTRVTVAKRVISTQKGAGVLFSSNYMESGTTKNSSASYYKDADDNLVVDLYVYNYATPKTNPFYRDDNIEYTITARMVKDINGTPLTDGDRTTISGLTYKFGDFRFNSTNGFETMLSSQTLSNDRSDRNHYTLTFDPSEISEIATPPGYCMYVEAQPVGITELPTIKGYIGVSLSETIDPGWRGEIVDENGMNYDGYNYEITGNGIGVLTITWNNTKLEPNDLIFNDSKFKFVNQDTDAVVTGGTNDSTSALIKVNGTNSSLMLKLDSNVDVRKLIQFYKVEDNVTYTIEQIKGFVDNGVWTSN